ncbi:hypothetical protein GXW82_13875 [Streptacidiphilus sp. 4-A2]|nr:hypothetical protein [Streptacidiphilus sp. 4-A2]
MGGSGWLKLFQGRFAPQIGWMYPFALIGLAFGLWWRRRAPRTDRLRGGYLMWGTWLLVVGLVFSKMGSIPHTAYMSTLAPPLAALAGAGGVLMWDVWRKGARSGWALPVAVAVETAWSWRLSSTESGFLPWLRWLALAAGVVGLAGLVWSRAGRGGRSRILAVGVLAALTGAVVTPVAWSASVLDVTYAGSAFDASAGPSAMGAMGTPAGGGQPAGGRAGAAGGFSGPGGTVVTTLSVDQRKLYDYVKAHRQGARYVLATDGWNAASPYILATGDTVMPMGGFSGSVPEPSLDAFESLVSQGQLRYVLLSGVGTGSGGNAFAGPGPGAGSGSGTGSVARIDAWVRSHCTQVPSTSYGVGAGDAVTPGARASSPNAGGAGVGTLYGCGSRP